MSINGLLNIAGQSIASNQIAINVTGANIANVNTPGYTRQKVNVSSFGTVSASGTADFGVRADGVERIYNSYLESQIVDYSQTVGYDEARDEILGRIAYVLDDTGTNGLNDLLGQFWNSWETLSANPSGNTARAGVASAAKNLASLISQKGSDLERANQEVRKSISDTVDGINSITSEIARINSRLSQMSTDNGDANDLMDRAMENLKELARNINLEYIENEDHTVDVFAANGKMLVIGSRSSELTAANGNVAFASSPADTINALISGGRLGGMIELNDATLAGYIDDLNSLADQITASVNARHAAGYDAAGTAGGLFFSDSPTGARNMSVSSAVLGDFQKIAASSSATGGDGENARLIGAMRDERLINGNTETFGDYYATMVGRFGYDVKSAESAVDRNTAAANQLSAQREKAAGVSIDEEIMNLVKFQFGYNAAGKLAKTADEMLDVLMALGQ